MKVILELWEELHCLQQHNQYPCIIQSSIAKIECFLSGSKAWQALINSITEFCRTKIWKKKKKEKAENLAKSTGKTKQIRIMGPNLKHA